MDASRAYPASTTLVAAGWLLYRRARVFTASALGRNPLAGARHLPPLGQDVRSLRQFVQGRKVPPRQVRGEGEDGAGAQWETTLGLLWAPPGANSAYIHLVSSEMLGGVYPLGGLAPGATVIDAGANIGCFARVAFLNGAARVIAFEPAPDNIVCLRRNVPKAEVYPAGVWNCETTLAFAEDSTTNPGSHHICEPSEATTSIPVTTIDTVVLSLKLNRLDYIKMDIEGAEVKALEGATESVRRFRPELAIATEHTDDILANTAAVIDAVRRIDGKYRYTVTESQMGRDREGRLVLIPYTLHFTPGA
jgi:FkbM family methyltransferase